jgi:hypothetical protein
MTPFMFTLFNPMKTRVLIVWLCLVIQDFGRSRVSETACDRVTYHGGGSMIGFLLKK